MATGRRVWITLGAVAVAVAALVDVRVTGPRIAVRWAPSVSDSSRAELERRYSLQDGRRDAGPEWRYQLRDRSRENIGALVRDPAVADTGYIDRAQLTAEEPEVEFGVRALPFPLSTDAEFRDLGQLFQIQSLCLLVAGGGLLWAARRDDERLRRRLAVATILAVAVLAYALPLPSTLHMGDADTYTSDRDSFESYTGVRAIRFEAHLSHAILGRLDAALGRTHDSPNQALNLLMRMATAWFVVSALGIGFLERWSPHVVRYLGLTLLAPAALLYFGYRELGHLSLNLAAYPLFIRGLGSGPPRLEAASVLSGLGAALHGFGLLSLAGSSLAALVMKARWTERVRDLLRVFAWGTAAYVGWIAIYVLVLNLPVTQGHAEVDSVAPVAGRPARRGPRQRRDPVGDRCPRPAVHGVGRWGAAAWRRCIPVADASRRAARGAGVHRAVDRVFDCVLAHPGTGRRDGSGRGGVSRRSMRWPGCARTTRDARRSRPSC